MKPLHSRLGGVMVRGDAGGLNFSAVSSFFLAPGALNPPGATVEVPHGFLWIGISMSGEVSYFSRSIMQAMLDEVAPKLKTGLRMLSESVRANARESDIGIQLDEIAKANPGVAIGSHPFFDPLHGPSINVVLRASDAQRLQYAKHAVEDAGACAGSPIGQSLSWPERRRATPPSPR
jgi:hypothetical protein